MEVLLHKDADMHPHVEDPQIDPPLNPHLHIPPEQQRRVIPDTMNVKTLFSLDDVPSSQWRNQLLQMYTWINAEMQAPDARLRDILGKFASQLSGRMQE